MTSSRSRLITLVVVAAGIGGAPSAAADPGRPNVLFIAVDDLNHWVGHLGRNPQARTPNIDRLARRGVWFTRGYCAAPACNPSRAALMSGLRPGVTGVYDNKTDFTPFIPEDITLTAQFRKAGYFVCGAGKIYHSSVYRAGEWDDWLGRDEPSAGASVETPAHPPAAAERAGNFMIAPTTCRDDEMPDSRVVEYVVSQLRRRHDRPFFIACGLTKPHLPWSVPAEHYDRFPLDGIRLPPFRADDLDDLPPAARHLATKGDDHEAVVGQGGTETWRRAVRAYLAAISFCDTMVGRVLDAYDASPERDDTIICFWSDHGWHLGEKHHWRKFALWEETTRVPLIWVVPGLTPPDGRCDRTVDTMSIYPTLMELCGLPVPPHVQGISVASLLADPGRPWDHPAISTFRQGNHSVRSETHRYTRYADGGEELYDEVADPYEWTNLAGSTAVDGGTRDRLASSVPRQDAPPADEPSAPGPPPAAAPPVGSGR